MTKDDYKKLSPKEKENLKFNFNRPEGPTGLKRIKPGYSDRSLLGRWFFTDGWSWLSKSGWNACTTEECRKIESWLENPGTSWQYEHDYGDFKVWLYCDANLASYEYVINGCRVRLVDYPQ